MSFSSLQQRTAEQITDIPVPRRRRGGGGGRQGFLPEQNSTAPSQQIVDIPVPRGGGLQDFRPGQVPTASSSHSPGAADEVFTGFFFTLFPKLKVRSPPRVRVRGCPPGQAHGLLRLTSRPRHTSSSPSCTRTCCGCVGGTRIGRGGPGGWMASMLGAYGGPHGSSFVHASQVPAGLKFVIVHDFQFLVWLVARRCRTTSAWAAYRLSESLFMRQSTLALGRISCIFLLALFTLENLVHYFFVSGSHTSCVWVLPVEY